MKTFFTKLWRILTKAQRRNFFLLQMLMIITACLELIGVASIAPFLAILSDASLVQNFEYWEIAEQYLGIDSEAELITVVGLFTVIAISCSSFASILLTKKLAFYSARTGSECADVLLEKHITKPWDFHARTSSSLIMNVLTVQIPRFTDLVLIPFTHLNSKIFQILALLTVLVLYEPLVTISVFLLFSVIYFILFKSLKKRLTKNGQLLTHQMQRRIQIVNNSISSIREIKIYNAHNAINESFHNTGLIYARARAQNHIYWFMPRYIVEFVAFASLVIMTIYLSVRNPEVLTNSIPTIGLFGIAALRLLPALQQCYTAIGQIQANKDALDQIYTQIEFGLRDTKVDSVSASKFKDLQENIILENVGYSYNSEQIILQGISLEIEKGQKVALVGESGSGKSTLVDIVAGLLRPDYGQLKIDNLPLNTYEQTAAWRNRVGYVSQDINLIEGSIAENIALGVQPNEIDVSHLLKVCEMSLLTDFIAKSPQGIDTFIGDKGLQLSGGQRQRLAIARALYFQRNFLIFDEATSALDNITENKITEAIMGLNPNVTVIMIAHRIHTIEQCDMIFVLKNGCIAEKGQFSDLVKSGAYFQELVQGLKK